MKNNKINIVVIILVVLISLALTKKNMKDSQTIRYFLDFDFYNLEGIKEQTEKPVLYPFIEEIKKNNSEKQYILHLKKDDEIKLNFSKTNGIWTKIETEQEGEFSFKHLSIYEKDKVQTFTLLMSENRSYLTSYEIMEKGKEIIKYTLNKSKKFSIEDINTFNIETIGKCSEKEINNVVIKEDLLSYDTKVIDCSTGDILYKNRTVYKHHKISFFWWSYMGYAYEKQVVDNAE